MEQKNVSIQDRWDWKRCRAMAVLTFTDLFLRLLFRNIAGYELYYSYAYMTLIVALLVSFPLLIKEGRDLASVMFYVYGVVFAVCYSGSWYSGGRVQSDIRDALTVFMFFIAGIMFGVFHYARLTKQSLLLERPVWYYLKKVDYGRVLVSRGFIMTILFVLVMIIAYFVISKNSREKMEQIRSGVEKRKG